MSCEETRIIHVSDVILRNAIAVYLLCVVGLSLYAVVPSLYAGGFYYMLWYNDKPTAYNYGTTAYNYGTTAYKNKPTAYNDETTAYNNKPTAYNDGTTAYNDKPTTHNK